MRRIGRSHLNLPRGSHLACPLAPNSRLLRSACYLPSEPHTSGTHHPVYTPTAFLDHRTMLRIADLLNSNGEDDSQLPEADSRAQVKLGRSVSAPERGARVDEDQDAAMAMMAMIDEDEHAVSCPEDKQSPCYLQTSARLRAHSRFVNEYQCSGSPALYSHLWRCVLQQNSREGGHEAVTTQTLALRRAAAVHDHQEHREPGRAHGS
jgi:hypothetical protein